MEKDWKEQLSPDEYYVCRKKGTEPAFSGEYDKFYEPGIYLCKCCKLELFSSNNKYDSGSGWPSFWQPLSEAVVDTEIDTSHGMVRVEALCHSCGAHIGHVFPDGPEPTGDRYCMNSASMRFGPQQAE